MQNNRYCSTRRELSCGSSSTTILCTFTQNFVYSSSWLLLWCRYDAVLWQQGVLIKKSFEPTIVLLRLSSAVTIYCLRSGRYMDVSTSQQVVVSRMQCWSRKQWEDSNYDQPTLLLARKHEKKNWQRDDQHQCRIPVPHESTCSIDRSFKLWPNKAFVNDNERLHLTGVHAACVWQFWRNTAKQRVAGVASEELTRSSSSERYTKR